MDSNSTSPQQLPPPNSPSNPPIMSPHKPRSICRNFVYYGVCRDVNCPRAHVPHNDMRDLVEYLMGRGDFPPGLRSVKQRLTPPKAGVCRKQLPSDRICRSFLPRPCPWGEKCVRTHFSVTSIYHSLQQPGERAKPLEAGGTPQLESETRSP